MLTRGVLDRAALGVAAAPDEQRRVLAVEGASVDRHVDVLAGHEQVHRRVIRLHTPALTHSDPEIKSIY